MARAAKTRCPKWQGLCLVNLQSRLAFEVSCQRWDCPHCVQVKAAVARWMIERGMRSARALDQRVRFITLTLGARGGSVGDLSAAWNRLRLKLVRERRLRAYVAVVELQRRGAPHMHVIATGAFIGQRKLSFWAQQAGFGPIVDIREVEDNEAVARYGAKMARYMTKESAKALRASRTGLATRIRPVRSSRNWYKGGLRAAERDYLAGRRKHLGTKKPTGRWIMVFRKRDGDVAVLGGLDRQALASPS